MKDSLRVAEHEDFEGNDALMLCGGVALAIFGVGLILSNRTVRRLLGQVQPGAIIAAAAPDFERYLKLRAM